MGVSPRASNQHRLHHLLWECYIGMTPVMEEAFAGSELTLALSGTLDEVATTPGATVSEIARRTPKTQQAISQAVAKLEKMGLVERRLGTGRGVGVYLTPQGEVAQADAVGREDRMERQLREKLGEDIYQELLAALEHSRPRFQVQDADALSERSKASQ